MSSAIELPPEVHALLAATPRRPDAVFAGGTRTTGIQLPDPGNGALVEPLMILWLDQTTGLIRSQRLINPAIRRADGVIEAIDCLLDACLSPGAGFSPEDREISRRGQAASTLQPFLPGKVVVTDEALARAVRDTLGAYGVEVERAESLPELDRVFTALLGMGRLFFDEGTSEPFAWDLESDLAKQLFRAAAAYWREAPWDYMPDHPPLAVALGAHGPEPGRGVVYASVLGAGGEVFGVGLYYSLEDYRRAQQTGSELQQREPEIDEALSMLRRSGAPVDDMPEDELRALVETMLHGPTLPGTRNTLVMWLDPTDESDPEYLAWIRQHGIRLFSREAVPTFLHIDAQGQIINPDDREARALAYALEALSRFFHRSHRLLDNPYYEPERRLSADFTVGPKDNANQQATVTITFPPEGYEWAAQEREDWFLSREEDEENPEEPQQEATEAGRNALYVFKATMTDKPDTWRRIEIRGAQSLGDLHRALQRAFNWDDDHLYAFFLSGKFWDPRAEYDDPRGEEGRDASRYLLEHLPLKRGQKIAYVFDFGDEWRVTLRLEKIVPDGINKRRKYPRIAEREGRAPPQYPTWGY